MKKTRKKKTTTMYHNSPFFILMIHNHTSNITSKQHPSENNVATIRKWLFSPPTKSAITSRSNRDSPADFFFFFLEFREKETIPSPNCSEIELLVLVPSDKEKFIRSLDFPADYLSFCLKD